MPNISSPNVGAKIFFFFVLVLRYPLYELVPRYPLYEAGCQNIHFLRAGAKTSLLLGSVPIYSSSEDWCQDIFGPWPDIYFLIASSGNCHLRISNPLLC